MSLPVFELLQPRTAADAVALRAANPASRFIAGGTDLLPNLRRGLLSSNALIDLRGVSELKEFRRTAVTLRLGAGVTLAAIAGDAVVASHWSVLAQAAASVAGPTHRASATLGGNLCLDTRCQYYNQSQSWRKGIDYCMKREGDICRVAPRSSRCYAAFSGDVAPALLALDATVELLGPEGPRRLPLRDLYRDDGMAWLAMAPHEMLLAVELKREEGWVSGYDKLRVRSAVDFPLVGIAAALRREGDAVTGLRVACTGISSRPEAIDGLDELIGKPLDEAALALIEKRIRKCTQPMETTVIPVPYRRRATPVMMRRLMQRLWDAD